MNPATIGAAGLVGALLLNRHLAGRETRPAQAGAGRIVGELHVVDEGHPAAPPAVLVHGFAGSLHWFDRLAPQLATDHRVLRIDLLGHGGSAKPATEYTIERQAEALDATLRELGIGPALFVGHSFGGAVAVALAERDRAPVERLVIMDEGPSNDFGDQSLMTRLGFVPVIGELMHRIAFDAAIRDGFREAFAGGFDMAAGFDDPDQVVRDYRTMTFGSYKGSWDGEEGYLATRRLDHRLRELGIPALMIFGEHDSFFRVRESADVFRGVPGVRVEVLGGVGHSPAVEWPEEVARLVREFAPVAAG